MRPDWTRELAIGAAIGAIPALLTFFWVRAQAWDAVRTGTRGRFCGCCPSPVLRGWARDVQNALLVPIDVAIGLTAAGLVLAAAGLVRWFWRTQSDEWRAWCERRLEPAYVVVLVIPLAVVAAFAFG